MDFLKFVVTLGDNYSTTDGINLFNLFWDIFVSILTGIVAFGGAYLIFNAGKKKEEIKEDERLLNDRRSLYFTFKYIRIACIDQVTKLNEVISAIELNELSQLESRISLIPTLQMNFGIIPDHLDKFNYSDFFKILIHKHQNINNNRIDTIQKFVINTDILKELVRQIPLLQKDLHDNYLENKNKVIEYYDKISDHIRIYWHERVLRVAEGTIEQMDVIDVPNRDIDNPEIRNIIIENFYLLLIQNNNTFLQLRDTATDRLTLEDTLRYILSIFAGCSAVLDIREVQNESMTLLNYCKYVLQYYSNIFENQRTILETLRSFRINFNEISENIHNVLRLEYPEYENDYDILN